MQAQKIKKINGNVRNCKKCILWKERKNAAPGEGPVNAKIMIIGQAPGANEDKTGRPFIGRAGQLLNQLLKIANIKREKVFITSIVKCFPPKNRKPTKREIQACLPYLNKQIGMINPRRFILLGEVAFSVFFQGEKLKDYRGKVTKKNNKEFFITYHPAAGLRFPRIKRILEKDFEGIRKY